MARPMACLEASIDRGSRVRPLKFARPCIGCRGTRSLRVALALVWLPVPGTLYAIPGTGYATVYWGICEYNYCIIMLVYEYNYTGIYNILQSYIPTIVIPTVQLYLVYIP